MGTAAPCKLCEICVVGDAKSNGPRSLAEELPRKEGGERKNMKRIYNWVAQRR